MAQTASISDPYLRIASIEEAFKRDMGSDRFIPYIQLHEFEALIFCDVTKLAIEYPKCIKEIESLKNVLAKYNGNPELINNSPETAPSKRIITAIQGKYKYNKPRSGAIVTASIGLPAIMHLCTHFREWIYQICNVTNVDSDQGDNN